MRSWLLSWSAALCVLIPTVAAGQDLPQSEVLSAMVEKALPSWWSVDQLEVIASDRSGGVAAPRAALRFEAVARPEHPLFGPVGEQVGPFEIVARTLDAQAARTLYGYVELVYEAGGWTGTTIVENPVDLLGTPVDLFEAPVLEMGSADLDARIMELRAGFDKAAAARLATLATEVEVERERRQGEAQEALARLQAEHEAEVARLVAEHEALVAGHEAANAAERARREAELAAARQAVDANHETEMERIRNEIAQSEFAGREALQVARVAAAEAERQERRRHATTLADLAEAQEAELASQRAEHARAVAELRAAAQAQLASEGEGYAAQLVATRARLAETKELQALQAELAAEREKISTGVAVIDAIDAEMVAKRRADLESLLGVWTGFTDCGRDGASQRVAFHAEEVAGVNVVGRYTEADSDERVAALSTGLPTVSVPSRLTLNLDGDDRKTIMNSGTVLELDETGRLVYRDGDCNFVMTR